MEFKSKICILLRAMFAAAVMLYTTGVANAGTITFEASGSFQTTGSLLSGTVTIDDDTATIVASDLIITDGANIYSFSLDAGDFGQGPFGAESDVFTKPTLYFYLPLFSAQDFLNYDGGDICSATLECGGGYATQERVVIGFGLTNYGLDDGGAGSGPRLWFWSRLRL